MLELSGQTKITLCKTCLLAKSFVAELNNSRSEWQAVETTDGPMSPQQRSRSKHKRYCEDVTSSIDERTETCPIRRRRRRRPRVSPPRAALTRLAEHPSARTPLQRARCGGGGHLARDEKTTRRGAAAPPAAGRRSARHWAARGGRGVGAGAAGGQSFDACRASGCRYGTSECRERAASRRVMDVA